MNAINFIAPTNKKELIQLLDEAIGMADYLNEQLDQIGKFLEEHHPFSHAA